MELRSHIPLLGIDFLKIIFVSVASDAVKQDSKHYSKFCEKHLHQKQPSFPKGSFEKLHVHTAYG